MNNRINRCLITFAILCVLVMTFAVPLASAASYSKVYGQTQDRIRVRESASTNATIIDNIVKGACVYVTSSSTSGSYTFVQIKYRAQDGSLVTGWACQSDGKETYIKILSAEQAKTTFKVSGGNLPSTKVGTFTATQRQASTSASSSSYIKLNSSGDAVKDLQTKLTALGYYSGTISGNVGTMTEAAIKAFQKANGLTADGIAGPQTLAKIDAAYAAKGGSSSSSSSSSSGNLKLYSTGTQVRNLQTDLTTLGYYWAEITGNFGTKTETAVKAFQKAYGLTVDGVAGTKTLEAIAAAVAKKGATSSSSSTTGSILKLNSQGTKVSQLQTNLTTLGYYSASITGNFGTQTEAAVKAFQKASGLTVDGIAGQDTLAAIAVAIEKKGGTTSSGSSSSGSSLKYGSSSDAVKNLQTNLTTLGYYYGDITGHFGTMTETAVKKFQKAYGLTQDGIAGSSTLAAIASAVTNSGSTPAGSTSSSSTSLRLGDSGTAVTELQTMLKQLEYYYGDITGSFGTLTQKAVRSFQDKNGLTVDGIAGTNTLNKLRSLTGSSGSAGSTGSAGGSTVTPTDSYGQTIKDNVYLRSAASTSSAAKASLKVGTLLRITKIYTVSGVKWYYVTVKLGSYTHNGYIRSDMMTTITEDQYNQGGGNSDYNYSDQEVLGMIRIKGTNVSLRYEPSTDATRVGVANTGDVFYYVDSVSGWFQTQSGYWISSQYAEVLSDEEASKYTGSTGSGTTTAASYRYGSTGDQVTFIQEALKDLGYFTGTVSGYFGYNTENAVKAFQRAYNLSVDGVVGSKTLAKIVEEYGNVSSGNGSTVGNGDVVYNLNWPTECTKAFKTAGFVKGAKATLTDIETGYTFNIKVQSLGASSHADVEPVTGSDTATLCKIYGVSTASKLPWNRRAMILTTSSGDKFVCSIYPQPHGTNTISGNSFDGQFCVHFSGSKINNGDGGSVPDNQNHQAIIINAVSTLAKKGVTVSTVYPYKE